jgi:hypothetical protein
MKNDAKNDRKNKPVLAMEREARFIFETLSKTLGE